MHETSKGPSFGALDLASTTGRYTMFMRAEAEAVRYDAFFQAIVQQRLLPNEFAALLSDIRDGSLLPLLDYADIDAPIPKTAAAQGRELAVLLAMLIGLRRCRGADEQEYRVRARVLRLVAAADS